MPSAAGIVWKNDRLLNIPQTGNDSPTKDLND
jgi:hypothetical protein